MTISDEAVAAYTADAQTLAPKIRASLVAAEGGDTSALQLLHAQLNTAAIETEDFLSLDRGALGGVDSGSAARGVHTDSGGTNKGDQ